MKLMVEASPRPPIAQSPLSVVLLADRTGPEMEETISAWLAYLNGLKREHEILVVTFGHNFPSLPSFPTPETNNKEERGGWGMEELRQRFPIPVFFHPDGTGLGSALSTALTATRHPLVFFTTCDKQFQPADLGRLLEFIDQVDLVTGYRVCYPVPGWLAWLDRIVRIGARILIGLPLEPRDSWLGWKGFIRRRLTRWLFGVRLRDAECAFRLFRREVFQRFPIQCQGPFAQVEILAKANFLGYWMAEVPVTWIPPKIDPANAREAWRLFFHPEFGPTCVREPIKSE